MPLPSPRRALEILKVKNGSTSSSKLTRQTALMSNYHSRQYYSSILMCTILICYSSMPIQCTILILLKCKDHHLNYATNWQCDDGHLE